MPPKKSFGGQKKDSQKKNTPPPPSGSNKTSGGKGKAADSSASAGAGGGGGGSAAKQQPQAQQAPTEPPQLTVKQIIGGLSWTGKVPVNLLSEHCQKSGWDGHVEYRIRQFPDGHLGSAVLRCRNPKTQLVEEVHFSPPLQMQLSTGETVKPHQPTNLEAKHYLATYVLNRVANAINIRFMLPPTHQGFWKVFEDIRKQDIREGRAWMYEPDPFLAQRERKAAQEKAEKQRAAKLAASSGAGGMVIGGAADNLLKGWQNVPVVEMGKDMRVKMEELIRKYHVWNPAGSHMSETVKKRVLAELVALGFRHSHVEEACEWTADREECFGESWEWWCYHG